MYYYGEREKTKKNYHEKNENKKNEMKWFLMNGSGLWHISKKRSKNGPKFYSYSHNDIELNKDIDAIGILTEK